MMDFKQLREERGLKLWQVAGLSGYKESTIADLENHGAGGKRLREKLMEVYGVSESENVLQEGPDLAGELGVWRNRAKAAEKELAELKEALRRLLEPKL